MTVTTDIDGYLKERQRARSRFLPKKVVTTEKPEFEEMHKLVSIPKDVWMNSQWGGIYNLFDFLREQNNIPNGALMEVELEGTFSNLNVRWSWWEATVNLDN